MFFRVTKSDKTNRSLFVNHFETFPERVWSFENEIVDLCLDGKRTPCTGVCWCARDDGTQCGEVRPNKILMVGYALHNVYNTGTMAHIIQYTFIPIAPDTAWWESMQALSYQALARGCPGQPCSTRLQMHSSNWFLDIGYNLEPNRGYAGERIFGSGVPLSKEDMYILGSSGKSMTSTMAARVVAKGYISWKTTTKEIFHDTVGWSWIVFLSNIQSRVCLTSIPPSKAQPWSLLSATAVALRAWT